MPDGQVLEFAGLTKRFGTISAVADLTCSIQPQLELQLLQHLLQLLRI